MSTYEERILGTTPKKKNFARLHTRRNAVSNRGGLPPLYNTDSTFLTGINGPPKGFATNSLARKVVPSARNLKTRLSMALSGESKTTDQKIQDKVGDLHYPPGFFSPQQIKEKGLVREQNGTAKTAQTPKTPARKAKESLLGDPQPQTKREIDELTNRVQGFPGGLQLTPSDTRKYFGDTSRTEFFDRYQWLHKQRGLATTAHDGEVPQLMFDAANPSDGFDNFAFSPIREKKQNKVTTKILIRSHNLSGDTLSETKLVPAPAGMVGMSLQAKLDSMHSSFDEMVVSGTESNAEVQRTSELATSSAGGTSAPGKEQEFPTVESAKAGSSKNPVSSGNGKVTVKLKRCGTSNHPGALKTENHGGYSHSTATSKKKGMKQKGMSKSASAVQPTRCNTATTNEGTSLSKQTDNSTATVEVTETVDKSEMLDSSSDEDDSYVHSIYADSSAQVYKAEDIAMSFMALTPVHNKKTEEANPQSSPVRSEPLHFVCIEKRDEKNRRVRKVDEKSIFKYVESRTSHHDFTADENSDSGDDDQVHEELLVLKHFVKEKSSVSPILKEYLQHRTKQYAFGDRAAFSSKPSTPSGGMRKDTSMGSADSIPDEQSQSATSFSSALADGVPLSPRSRYIDSCIRKRLNPRASLILRKHFTKQINLQHFGMGDDMAILFAEAIKSIPYIESLHIADNNLTDRGLGPIVLAVKEMKELYDLDMSYNIIGPIAATALAEYLADAQCLLERLTLRRADVDDGECERFVTALKENNSLTELDLSENLVGTSENLNTVMPDIVTGGEALADLLRSETCGLTTLKLGWNMLRLDGAVDLCSSLSENATLTYLDLSFNSLSSNGGIALGNALQDNVHLTTLIISNNSLDAMACVTICAGVIENSSLQHIAFDGNPIGEEGAKALMLLPTMVGSSLKISAVNCNITIRDPNCWFDASQLLHKFEIHLDRPFERSVALFVLNLVASHQTYVISHSSWYDDVNKVTENLNLVQRVRENNRLDSDQRQTVDRLRSIQTVANDINLAVKLFNDVDVDRSGRLDEQEFEDLIGKLGIELKDITVKELMAEYDVDGGGVIEMEEFLLLLKNQHRLATKRLKELLVLPILSREADAITKEKYVPPRHGVLSLTVLDGFAKKENHRVISDTDRKYIGDIAKQSGDLVSMTSYGVQSYKIRIGEALKMVDSMLQENSNKTTVLSKVLPQMISPTEARALVSKVLNNNKVEIQRLQREIGAAYRPIMGTCDGFYSLDLSNQMDKICLNRLIELSMTNTHYRSQKSNMGYGMVGDCSQKGNWTGFRNESFKGKPIAITSAFASPMPRTGRLEFDFVSERRPASDDFILSDVRVTNMLTKCFLLRTADRMEALRMLAKSKAASAKTLAGDGTTVYETPKEKAEEIGLHQYNFYENILLRHEQIDKARHNEMVTVTIDETDRLTYANIYSKVTIQSLKEIRRTTRLVVENKQPRRMPRQSAITPKASTLKQSVTKSKMSGAEGTAPVVPINKGELESALATVPVGVGEETSKAQSSEPNTARSSNGASRQQTSRIDTTHESTALVKPSAITTRPNTNHRNAESDDDEQYNTNVGYDESQDSYDAFDRFDDFANVNLLTPKGVFQSAAKKILQQNRVSKIIQDAELEESMLRYVRTISAAQVSKEAKAAKILELLINQFEHYFLMARHLELIVLLFHEFGQLKHTEFFGTYRTELVVSLFSCVVDLYNFEIVMRALNPYECATVICRIGYLHIFNPMKPEGSYEFDLSRREERLIVKMLAQLATAEPGDNLPELCFRWERTMDHMPGYTLTELWMTEDGLPRKGHWGATYYAGEGKGKKGCKAHKKYRRAMLNLVFLDEEEIKEEGDHDNESADILAVISGDDGDTRKGDTAQSLIAQHHLAERTKGESVGTAFMKANINVWHSYLNYNEEEHLKIAHAKAAANAPKKRGQKK